MRGKRLRLPRLGRRGRIVRNLLLASVAVVLVWGIQGYPIPSEELAFRRLEQRYLLPSSEIVYQSGEMGVLEGENGLRLGVKGQWVVGVRENRVVSAADLNAIGGLDCYPYQQSVPTPVPAYGARAIESRPGWLQSAVPVLFLDVPAEAARAELEITGDEGRYSGSGWPLGEGRWLFAANPGSSFSGSWCQGADYVLRLYGADGVQLAVHTGILPAPLTAF